MKKRYYIKASGKYPLLKSGKFALAEKREQLKLFSRKKYAVAAIISFLNQYPNCEVWKLEVQRIEF